MPPQSSKYFNDDYFSTLEEEIMSTCSNNDYVYLMGDLNAQTANLNDYTSNDESLDKYLDLDSDTIECFDQESFFKNNGITMNRTSQDIKKNNIGYRIIDVCKNNNMFILNGRYGQDEGVGSFTFRDQSVIDFAITSRRGISILSDFEIQDLDRIFSDGHSLLKVTIKITTPISKINPKILKYPHKPRWEQQKATTFSENIDETEIRNIESYTDSFESKILQQNIDEVTLKITNCTNSQPKKRLLRKVPHLVP